MADSIWTAARSGRLRPRRLPTWKLEVDSEGVFRSGVEVLITDRREKEIADLRAKGARY